MAKIIFDAFIEDVVRGRQSGDIFALRTSETHRKKGEDGQYHTTARTYRTVKLAKSSIPGVVETLEGFKKGDRIHVEGTEKTEKYTTAKGDAYTLTVYADSVTLTSDHYTPRAADEEPF